MLILKFKNGVFFNSCSDSYFILAVFVGGLAGLVQNNPPVTGRDVLISQICSVASSPMTLKLLTDFFKDTSDPCKRLMPDVVDGAFGKELRNHLPSSCKKKTGVRCNKNKIIKFTQEFKRCSVNLPFIKWRRIHEK